MARLADEDSRQVSVQTSLADAIADAQQGKPQEQAT